MYFKNLFFFLNKIHRLLGSCDGGGRFYGTAENNRRAVCDSAVYSAVMVGFRLDFSVFINAEGVVGFACAHICHGKAASELDALNCGNAEKNMGKAAFHAVKKRFAHTGGYADDGGFKHSADAVKVFFCRKNCFFHLLSGFGVKNGEVFGIKQIYVPVKIPESPVLYSAAGSNMGADFDSPAVKGGNGYGAGGDKRRGNPPAEMTAAPVILISVIFALGGIVRVPRSGTAGNFGIVPAYGVFVGNKYRYGRSRGKAAENAA